MNYSKWSPSKYCAFSFLVFWLIKGALSDVESDVYDHSKVYNHHHSIEKHPLYNPMSLTSNVYILFSSWISIISCP
jgi:hypothetical protein